MAKAKRHDHQGAIGDYTTTLGIPGTPADLLAMVLYNRALVYVAAGEAQKGTDDLDAVLAMDEEVVNVKTMARRKLARMESRASKNNA
jgi:dihydroxyacid dehydratase/phosphogluconate dehydratase